MTRFFIAALVVLLTSATAWGAEPSQLTVLEPREGSVVSSDVPRISVELPPDVRATAWFVLAIDGRPLARFCVDYSPTLTQCSFFSVGAPASLRPIWNWALRPDLAVLASRPELMARDVYATKAGDLGYLKPGEHELAVELHEGPGFGSNAGGLVASQTVRFRIAADKRTNLIYDNQFPAATIASGSSLQPGLGPNRGGFRQAARTSVSPWGFSRLSGKSLAKQSGPEMADTIRRAIERGCGAKPRRRLPAHCAGSGRVSIDELTPDFADWDAQTRADRGRDGPGARLAEALRLLNRRSPWPFTYASRVNIFVSPTVMVALASPGRSPLSFRQVAPGLARAGGLWMEMYRGTAGFGAEAFSEELWTQAPRGVLRLLRSVGGDEANLHFLMTRGIRVPRVRDRFGNTCGGPMACQWALAESTPLNRRILANGVGAYRTSDQAADWLAEYNRRF